MISTIHKYFQWQDKRQSAAAPRPRTRLRSIDGKALIDVQQYLGVPMEDASARAHTPSRKALENYASAYLGAYMNAVEREKPEHVPPLARNAPYNIEVCLMPNQSFVMLFERSGAQKISVQEKDWNHVESVVMGGVSHLVTVYAHEGPTVADAISKGKKDAVRDIRSMEDSGVAKSVAQLEQILEELSSIERGNKDVLKVAEAQLQKLQPIRDAVRDAGPDIDMLGMIDALRNCPSVPAGPSVGDKEVQLLRDMCQELGDLSDIIRRIESQDQRLEVLQQVLTKGLSEFGKSLDDKLGKGLAMVLSSSDRKIDKALSEVETQIAMLRDEEVPRDLEDRLRRIEESLSGMSGRPEVVKEMVLAVADVRENLGRLGQRVTKIEQSLAEAAKQRAVVRR